MKPSDDWEPALPGPPFEESDQKDDSPEFATIRRIELLGRLHHMAFRSVLRDEGLPPAQMGALRFIIRTPGLSQRELADQLHIQRATATVMLQKMEKAGYIDRRPDQGDQRISRIYPTETALTSEAENQKNFSAYFARCFSGVSPEHFEITQTCLQTLEENLRTILGEAPIDKE